MLTYDVQTNASSPVSNLKHSLAIRSSLILHLQRDLSTLAPEHRNQVSNMLRRKRRHEQLPLLLMHISLSEHQTLHTTHRQPSPVASPSLYSPTLAP